MVWIPPTRKSLPIQSEKPPSLLPAEEESAPNTEDSTV
ncbi:hypothetical protein Tco_1040037, partial [Tanacetum coccineum]